MLDVDMVMRSDYQQTFGGDVVQAQHYAQHMPEGISVRVLAAGPHLPLRESSILHIVNIDREWDYLEVTHQAGTRPIIVTSIHHDHAAADRIGRLRRRSPRTVVQAALPGPTFSLLTRLYRGRSWPRTGRLPAAAYLRPHALRAEVGRALARADLVHVAADGERRSIERDFDVVLPHVVVIPNGVELSTPRRSSGERDVPILVPGRIDPRKNQVAVAKELHRVRQPAVFVGAPHPTGGDYVERFAQLAASSPWITWVKGVPPEAMAGWYQRSKIVLNLSLVEVLSHVDLEAYASGCRLVTTTNGHTAEWLGSSATYVDPSQVEKAVALARQRLVEWTPLEPAPELVARFDWAQIGAELAAAYRSIGRGRDGSAR
jgi:glycosyltransferase involved in cell wall biosynthesis